MKLIPFLNNSLNGIYQIKIADGEKMKTVLVYIHGAGIDGGSRLDTLLAPDFLLSQRTREQH